MSAVESSRTVGASETEALQIARHLIEHGVPVFAARPATDGQGQWDPAGGTGGTGYVLPTSWEKTVPTTAWLDPSVRGFEGKAWRPGWALCAVMGDVVDGLDVDPRSGGDSSRAELVAAGTWPTVYGVAATPSGGTHELVAALRTGSRDGLRPGLDVKGGRVNGTGRGFLFIAPTVKVSKTTGELAAYRWTTPPDLRPLDHDVDTSGAALAELVARALGGPTNRSGSSGQGMVLDDAKLQGPAYDQQDAELRASVDRHVLEKVRNIGYELRQAGSLPPGERDGLGRGWQKLTADACWHLGALARARWNALTVEQARAVVLEAAPVDGTWTAGDVEMTWRAQHGRKAPAPWPESLERARGAAGVAGGAGAPPAVSALAEPALEQGEDGGQGAAASWSPVPLGEVVAGLLDGSLPRLAPSVGRRQDGGALFYAGKVNGVAGASGSGKSWTALAVTAQEVQAGRHVVYVDLEDDAAGVVGRLLDLGLDPAALVERFNYLHPDEGYSSAAAARLLELVQRFTPRLVVIDSTGESMALDGAKPNDDDDVARWFRRFPARVARLGPAVVVLDHVVKAEDGGLWPIGSQRKRAAISGAQYMQQLVRPFAKGQRGAARLVCAKDRHGAYRVGEKAAELTVEPSGSGVTVALVAVEAVGTGGGVFRPTALMERVSRHLEAAAEPVSRSGITDRVVGKRVGLLGALDVLVAEGYVEVTVGPRRAELCHSTRPYRQAQDPASDVYESRERVEGSTGAPGTPRPLPDPFPPKKRERGTGQEGESTRSRERVGNGSGTGADNGPDAPVGPTSPSPPDDVVPADHCRECGAELLLKKPGRTLCEKCRHALVVAS